MPLVSMRQLLDHAAENGYGIPASRPIRPMPLMPTRMNCFLSMFRIYWKFWSGFMSVR
jgi:hypothetical protein